jgi:hypothetical protein
MAGGELVRRDFAAREPINLADILQRRSSAFRENSSNGAKQKTR